MKATLKRILVIASCALATILATAISAGATDGPPFPLPPL